MLRNKIIYSGEVLLDLTGDTVTVDDLVTGVTAHDKSGTPITGGNPYAKAATDAKVDDQAALISQIQTALQGKTAGDSGGITPSGTITITENGTHDVASYAQAVVNVPTGSAGSGGPYSKWQMLVWTPSETTYTTTINHSLGVVPDGFLVVLRSSSGLPTDGGYNVYYYTFDVSTYEMFGLYTSVSASIRDMTANNRIVNTSVLSDLCTDEMIILALPTGSTAHQFPAGATYDILVYKR